MRRLLSYIVLFLGAPFFSYAAQLSVESSPTMARMGEFVEVSLLLDPQDEVINAIEGSVSFSSHFKIEAIKSGDSIIPYWVVEPYDSGDTVFFAGIVPGGYSGDVSPKWKGYHPGKVLTLVLNAVEEGDGWVQVGRETRVLLHDGKGTDADVLVKDTDILVQGNNAVPVEYEWRDDISPEPFTPLFYREERFFFADKRYIVFVTQDKDSGIDYYEITVGKETFIAQSPYYLKDSSYEGEVLITAYDKAGNTHVESVFVTSDIPWYNTIIIRTIVLLLVLALLLVGIVRYYRLRHGKRTPKDN
jgi:hypothetical protein